MTDKTHEADVAFIKALAELLRENDLTELEVKREYAKDDGLNVRVSRKSEVTATMAIPAPAAPAPAHAPVAAPAPAPVAAAAASDDPADHPGAVTSPMVGTVYLQPEPTSPAFVKVGDTVSEGDTLLIVEAMKTMNHIPATRSGVVKRILVEDKAAVEYGSPLMIIE
ncbi:acetyl-CoA carboxylase biotin carboxyl carrier protein [Pseudooceanicola sediminis]|uniref:Biotin carboxyl carrier protein of acetyl-CoA carboxylase n=1 Tax=Pseudooceanicola sediminis TaxID=2211117 RepID=A0A399J1R6_9RHOB|nr:acetyl-CoA carboxylase biotin carboxyl carrier protein [Pseudooceanicola sediminis]KAA2313140.1 acetyl-CoA carboxylase biotin carboxyl carrier protein [Puniceibacterium sp. HSS470]RII37862.1 acetyl-CoA carboxylase biotin carboxyl carrier protein [Pseudooceanicola sediminis]|tara:strand:- start:86948 stop:87448 length:501 start_codon:yes stop_codon:yes gene_type:complete